MDGCEGDESKGKVRCRGVRVKEATCSVERTTPRLIKTQPVQFHLI